MSDLQAAIQWVEKDVFARPHKKWQGKRAPGDIILEAARKYANGTPTYLVYTRQDDVGYLGHIYQGLKASRMSANPNLPGEWFTALGVTEDE